MSSTLEDLRDERAEVQKALLKLNCLPVIMELFPAADDETWEFIKSQIDDSDYYIVLIGGRYGSLAPDGYSFTEKEYDYARRHDIPSIGFVHENRAAIEAGKTDIGNPELIAKLDAFISKVCKRPVRRFSTPHQLALEVTTSFIDLKRMKPRTGYVRADQAVDYKTYAGLLEENKQLQRAYLGSTPGGLHEMTDGTIIAHVNLVNYGNLPAKKVRNAVRIGWFEDGDKSDFEDVRITEPGALLLLPKATYERGTPNLSEADAALYRAKKGYVYVWGRVEYDDGFGEPKWLDFCHRYNCQKPEIQRLHYHHNDGN